MAEQAPKTEDEAILAMCRAHDREESAQKGEPSPWREDFAKDPDWEQERFLAMREAFDVARAFLLPEERAATQRGDETLPFPVHVKVWPREEGTPDPVADVLGLAAKPWVLAGIAGELARAGAAFPSKMEAEMSVALHWLLVHVLTPGSGGMETVMAQLKAMRAQSNASETLSGTAPGLAVNDGLDEEPPTHHPNGAPMWAEDGTLLDEQGNRSIFDDLDR